MPTSLITAIISPVPPQDLTFEADGTPAAPKHSNLRLIYPPTPDARYVLAGIAPGWVACRDIVVTSDFRRRDLRQLLSIIRQGGHEALAPLESLEGAWGPAMCALILVEMSHHREQIREAGLDVPLHEVVDTDPVGPGGYGESKC